MSKQPTIIRTDLTRVLTDAALFATKSAEIPILNAVRLEATGTHLLAVATDRFSMGIASAEYQGTPFSITLPMAGVKLVLGACKLKSANRRWAPKYDVDLRVTPKGTLLRVTLDETVVTVPTVTDNSGSYFPDWRKLLAASNDADGEVSPTIGVNPEYLARFAKIGRKAKFYLHGAAKPVMARVGEDFIGLVMPIRLEDDDPKVWALPEWLAPSTGTIAAAS